MKRLVPLFLALAASTTLHAQTGGTKGMDMKDMDMKDQKGMDMKGMDKQGKAGKKAPSKTHHGVGVVKSVDAAKGTVTVDHQAVQTMSWPAMTMTFKAKDKKMLEKLAPGKNVEFDFVQQGKDHVITSVK